MTLYVGTRVKLADRPNDLVLANDWKHYKYQSKDSNGIIVSIIDGMRELWVNVKWDHGYENAYPGWALVPMASALELMANEYEEIIRAQELIQG